jgi:hypothetical protein
LDWPWRFLLIAEGFRPKKCPLLLFGEFLLPVFRLLFVFVVIIISGGCDQGFGLECPLAFRRRSSVLLQHVTQGAWRALRRHRNPRGQGRFAVPTFGWLAAPAMALQPAGIRKQEERVEGRPCAML